MSKELSIECAKDYRDDSRDAALIEALQQRLQLINSQGVSYSQTLLVDDTSYADKAFELAGAVRWLEDESLTPVIIFQESDLKDSCDSLLESVNFGNLPPELSDILRSERKYSCASLFLAVWYLIRLGYLDHPHFPKSQIGERILNILPASFIPDDNGALDILRTTQYAEAVEKVENIYI
jgi:hypothetical protein